MIVGNVDLASHRDIIVERQSGKLQRIDELHPGYLGFQYPLLFLYGEDKYISDVLQSDSHITQDTKRNLLTIRE